MSPRGSTSRWGGGSKSQRTPAHRVVAGSRVFLAGVCVASLGSAAVQGQGEDLQPASMPAIEAPADPLAENEPMDFKEMSLDELMDVEVTSVSRRPEKLMEAASAIQIVTGEEIRRSGALILPEALRLLPNLQVAQLNAHDWGITSRGFNGAPTANGALTDKLLVMIDGRSVYTPLFGGVFWDVQNVLLEDVDRIEAVSGPGGTLWGANAVNGVINIITKSAKDTQGLYVSGGGGSFTQDLASVRYGGSAGSNLFFRVYAQRFDRNNTELSTGSDFTDDWDMTQGGFRMDYYPSDADTLTLQGDIYAGTEGAPTTATVDGQNLLGRWTHTFSEESDLSLQIYFDRTWRDMPTSSFSDDLQTYDFDFQHRFPLGERQSIIWGLGYRLMRDDVNNSVSVSFSPARRYMHLFSGFVQDEIALVPDRLKLTVGTKLEHNDFSGFEVQPSARVAWTPLQQHTVWAAVSRAVRSPSRFDADEVTPFIITPGGEFDSEKVVAYELGYRVRPVDIVSLSLAAFYNRYDEIRTINFNPAPPPLFVFANDQDAESWGFELSGDIQATAWWRLRGGYTFLDKNIWATSAAVVPGSDTVEASDPHNQFVLQSIMDLPAHFQLDLVGRYVSKLSSRRVPAYFTFDARLGWQWQNIELAIVGQNLWDGQHPEFAPLEIPRSVFGKVTLRW